ncbi:MAG: DUF5011 domain-containing protein, partial [Nitrospirae bacterium]|nr:DUF5011 domain-containing protein [Nitrospirota bacterium]
ADGDGICTGTAFAAPATGANDKCPADTDNDADGDGICSGLLFAAPATGGGDFCPGDANNDADGDNLCAGPLFAAPATGGGDPCPLDVNNDADGDGICTGTAFAAPATGANDKCPADTDNDADGDGICSGLLFAAPATGGGDFCPGDATNDADGDGLCAGLLFAAPATGGGDKCPADLDNDADGDGLCTGAAFAAPATGSNDKCPADTDNDADADGICTGAAFAAPATGGGDKCPADTDNDSDGDGLCKGAFFAPPATGADDICPGDVNNDSDGDGVCTGPTFATPARAAGDNCPTAANANQANLDGDLFGDFCDPDIDGDGIPNAPDPCPNDAANACVGVADADADGLPDAMDPCPFDATNTCPGTRDSDGDSVPDRIDAFPYDKAEWWDSDGDLVGDNRDPCTYDAANACPAALVDTDSDGMPDWLDPCPADFNNLCPAAVADDDGDGVPNFMDPCPAEPDNLCATVGDWDGDGVPDTEDTFPILATEWLDRDYDGVGDNGDNCPWVFNTPQTDVDGNGVGDLCERVATPIDALLGAGIAWNEGGSELYGPALLPTFAYGSLSWDILTAITTDIAFKWDVLAPAWVTQAPAGKFVLGPTGIWNLVADTTTVDAVSPDGMTAATSDRDGIGTVLASADLTAGTFDLAGLPMGPFLERPWHLALNDTLANFAPGTRMVEQTAIQTQDAYAIAEDTGCQNDGLGTFALLNGNCNAVAIGAGAYATALADVIVATPYQFDGQTVPFGPIVGTDLRGRRLVAELVDGGLGTSGGVTYYIVDPVRRNPVTNAETVFPGGIGTWLTQPVNGASLLAFDVAMGLDDFLAGGPSTRFLTVQDGFVRMGVHTPVGTIATEPGLLDGAAMADVLAHFAPDSDGDGVIDTADACPTQDATGWDANPRDGCVDDSDGDGIPDNLDVCPLDTDNDSDGDGICMGAAFNAPAVAGNDVCPADTDNDSDGDGICAGASFQAPATAGGDFCPADANNDADGDRICAGPVFAAPAVAGNDVCPVDADNDSDGDGICAGASFQAPATAGGDICPADANNDADLDGICMGATFQPPATAGGDICPADTDNDADLDGICVGATFQAPAVGGGDLCPLDNPNGYDANLDGCTDPDVTPPVITRLGSTPITIAHGSIYGDAGATALDDKNGNITAAIVATNPVNTGLVGGYTVTYNVSDAAGNPAIPVTRTVNVTDQTAPVIGLLGTSPVTVTLGSVYTDAGAVATDNVDGDLTAAIVTTGTVNTAVTGSYTVTYNVSDAAGNNAAPVVRTVMVADLNPPLITLLGASPVTVPHGSVYVDAGATAADDLDGDITANIVPTSTVNTAVVGSYTVTYNVSDTGGNAATPVVRTVNVTDQAPPVITLLGGNPVSTPLGSPYTDAGATATDAVEGNLTAGLVVANTVNTAVLGTYTVTFNITDGSGNAATPVVRTVYVTDQTAPVITLLGTSPVTLEAGTAYVDAGATAADTVDGNLTAAIVTNSTVNTAVPGSYTVTYNVSDSGGNPALPVTRSVNVVDTTAPTLTITGANPATVEAGVAYTDSGATASDIVDGNLTPSIITTSTVNSAVPGTYTVTYNVTDAAGNAATAAVRTVTVADSSPPVIVILGANPVTVPLNGTYVDAGANAADLVDGNLTASIVTVNPVNPLVLGTYLVTYNVTDSGGNPAITAVRTVNVTDQTLPVVTAPANIVVPAVDATGTPASNAAIVAFLAGATALDNVDGVLTAFITHNAPAQFPLGATIVTFSVTDAAGNVGTAQATVTVTDQTVPVITLVGASPLAWPLGTVYADPGATALDNVDGTISLNIVVNSTAVNTALLGSYV